MALINHLRLSSVGPSDSLFSVRSPSTQSTQPITYYHFSKFLAKVVTALGLDTRAYSPHSFRHGGASFAFAMFLQILSSFKAIGAAMCTTVYLEMSPAQKHSAVNSLPSKIHQLVFY